MENLKILNQLKELNETIKKCFYKLNTSIVRLTDYIIEINDKTNEHLVLIYERLKPF